MHFIAFLHATVAANATAQEMGKRRPNKNLSR